MWAKEWVQGKWKLKGGCLACMRSWVHSQRTKKKKIKIILSLPCIHRSSFSQVTQEGCGAGTEVGDLHAWCTNSGDMKIQLQPMFALRCCGSVEETSIYLLDSSIEGLEVNRKRSTNERGHPMVRDRSSVKQRWWVKCERTHYEFGEEMESQCGQPCAHNGAHRHHWEKNLLRPSVPILIRKWLDLGGYADAILCQNP